MTLIDTSAWIEHLRKDGNGEVRSRVSAVLLSGDAAWCPVVRVELWNGARGTREYAVLREMESTLHDLPIDETVWGSATELAKKCRASGLTIPATDIVIAACAARHGVGLEHADRHFDLIRGIHETK